MCGIFGYVGKRSDAAEVVLDGLKKLEYRGYDSWGVAVRVSKLQTPNSKLVVEKHIGKIGNAKVDLPKSNIGIGHTRWATHGGVTQENAHPHLDCSGKIALVHNGIVENFQQLKKELVSRGHKFVSETDTEVIAHLIEEFSKKEPFVEAVRKTFLKLEGLNAVVVLESDSGKIVAVKNGSPLIAGKGYGELFIASDAAGIIKYTRDVLFVEDNRMVILGDKLRLFDLKSGKEVKPDYQSIDWKFEESEKGKFKHFFLKEIYEQPKILENMAVNSTGQIEKLAQMIEKAYGTFFIACGSASYSALAGTYLFSKLAKKHVNFAIGSEFNYLEDFIKKGSLVIPVSQSGESIDVIQPVVRAKQKGAKIAAIVNVLGSTLYREGDFKVLLSSGPEKAVAATKSLTAMFATMILCAYCLIGKIKTGQKLILAAAKNVSLVLDDKYTFKIKKLAKELKSKEHIYVLGRGLSYSTALEATLKLKEVSYIHTEGFAGGELKHGVIALIEKGTPCIVFAPNDETYSEIISNAAEVKARGGYIIGVGPVNNPVFDRWLETDDCGEATSIVQIVISQLLAYFLALEKGISDPDKPRNLAKSVTVK